MNIFSELIKEIEDIPGAIAGLFSHDQVQIQNDLSAAQTALHTASAVLAITGETSAATELNKVATVVNSAGTTVAALGTQEDLSQVATTIGGAVETFVNSGVAIKNAAAQTAADNAVTKTQQVVDTINTTLTAANPAS